MTPEHWKRVSELFEAAVEREPAARADFLAKAAAGDPALAEEVLRLLACDESAGTFLNTPPGLGSSSTSDYHLAGRHPGLRFERGPLGPALQSPSAGEIVGAYRLLRPLGEGGMGVVWLAERTDGRFQGQAAVKFLSSSVLHRSEGRFKREGSILSRLAHPHIARLLDAGVSEVGRLYLVLEYVDGESIDTYCDRHRFSLEQRIRLSLEVMQAVAHAHANLIIHRDLKPSNVLVDSEGQVKLLDFGIAKLIEEEGASEASTMLTCEGELALTPICAAPEQLTGEAVTTATDVYALGILIYQLLSGGHPMGEAIRSPAKLVTTVIQIEAPLMSQAFAERAKDSASAVETASRRGTTPEKLRRMLEGDLDTILAKALKKDPRARYPSVSSMLEDFQRFLGHQPISARPDSLAYRCAKFVRRNRIPVALATVALTATLAGIVTTSIEARRARTQRDFALRQLSRAEAINDLNRFILVQAAPSGKPFTVRELLDRAERVVGKQSAGNQLDRAELLVAIGGHYMSFEDDDNGRRILTEAYDLSRQLSDRMIRAKASCALGAALASAGDLNRAEELVDEGLHELPADPQFDLDRIFCLSRGGEVARERGTPAEAIARIQASRALLSKSSFRSEPLELTQLIDLAESYRVAGMHFDASAAFEDAWRRLSALGRDDTEQAGTLLNNWGVSLLQIGRPLDSEKILRRAIEISRANTTEDAVSPMLLINYGRALRDLGKLDAAAEYFERGFTKAQRVGQDVVIRQSLLALASIYRAQGDLARAESMLSQVEPRLRRALPPGHIAFASMTSEQALLSQARGQLASALTLATEAVAITQASVDAGGQGSDFLPAVLVRRADLLLQLERPDDAAADAARALAMLQKSAPPGTLASTLGRAQQALGRALLAQGKRQEAIAALRAAVEHFEAAFGVEHQETRNARHLVQTDS